ncbi:MAG: fibrobacter succinogenes major paralogous domain-containing protein [Fibrobacteres bacterium]|nr:fibrobacter succinogenes major paralogous domain-containing protein [Fibrobacterota bacterium]
MKSKYLIALLSVAIFSCREFEGKQGAIKQAIARDVEIFHSRDSAQGDNQQIITMIDEDNKLRQQNIDLLIKYAGDPDVDSLTSLLREEINFNNARSKAKNRYIDLNEIRCPKLMGQANQACSEYRRAKRLATEQVSSALEIQRHLVEKQRSLSHLGVPQLYFIEGESQKQPKSEPTIPVTTISPSTVLRDTIIDSRDHSVYPTVKIGNQTWTAKNMEFAPVGYVSKCQNNQCDTYGRLYAWDAANHACPDGWHLPTQAEWETLENNVGGENAARVNLRSTSGWKNNANGQDEYGFTVLPGSAFNGDGRFYETGSYAYFWSSTQEKMVSAWFADLSDQTVTGLGESGKNKANGFSVRCIKQ